MNFVSYLCFRQIAVFFLNLNFYFIKTANITVFGNIAVYITYCDVCITIDYSLKYLFA